MPSGYFLLLKLSKKNCFQLSIKILQTDIQVIVEEVISVGIEVVGIFVQESDRQVFEDLFQATPSLYRFTKVRSEIFFNLKRRFDSNFNYL